MTARTLLHRRIAAASATALLAVTGAGLMSAPEAEAAATGYTTAALTVRSGTSTGTSALTTIPSGVAISVQCQTAGQTVYGTYTTNYWGKVTYNGRTGYVSRAYLRVPDATGLGECSTSAPAPDLSAARQRVLDRGRNWVQRAIPYSMYAYASGPDADGYRWRTDCSGMIAMAYNLRDQSYYTGNLTDRFYPITKSSLQPGDIIGNLGDPASAGANGHVVIFNGWTDSSRTRFRTIEQAGGVGASEQVRTWGNSFWNHQGYRYKGW